MYRKFRLTAFLSSAALTFVLTGCDPSFLSSTDAPSHADSRTSHFAKSQNNGPGALTVMTRNLYIGADVDRVLAAETPDQIPIRAAEALQTVVATNFPERAAAVAAEIASARPHLVGLQEVEVLRRQSPGDILIGGNTPADVIFLDFLDILMSSIAALGLEYYVVGMVENTDIELPMLANPTAFPDPSAFDDIRVTDFDVLLARSDVATANTSAANFVAELPIPGLGIAIKRGYVVTDATVLGRTFTVANTHLEPVAVPQILPLQMAQAAELIAALDASAHPIVLLGDLNTPAPDGPTYGLFEDAGYVDLWDHAVGADADDGFTCCFVEDLRGLDRVPNVRIDFALYRSPNEGHGNDGLGAVFADAVGEDVADLTPSGLWPSDHVGVIASIRVPAAAHK